MSITIKKELTITDDTHWFMAAPPKGKDKQWKDGYSAKELAKFVTNNSASFNNLIQNIVKESFKKRVSVSFYGEPEADTNLPPKGSRGPRNHDLLLYNDDLVIGIEAKVNEPFGDTISGELSKAEQKDRTNMIERIKWLKQTILPNGIQENVEIEQLKYQLFTATAGTLLEAYRRNLTKCIVLILSFVDKENEPNEDNEESFDKYVKVVCNGSNKRIFEIKDYENNTNETREIECVFIKQDIKISEIEYIPIKKNNG